MPTILPAVRYFTEDDEYHYTVENRVAQDLAARDDVLEGMLQLSVAPIAVNVPSDPVGTISATNVQAAIAELEFEKQNTSEKNQFGGYVGLVGYNIAFKNALNSYVSYLTNNNTGSRSYTFPDRSGIIADNTDLALKANLSSPTFTGWVNGITAAMVGAPSGSGTSTGTNTGDQTSIVGITGTTAQFNTALTDGDFATLAGVEALTNKTLNGLTVTASTGTLTIGNGKTLSADDNFSITGTPGTLTFQGSDTYVGRNTTDALTNKTYNGLSLSPLASGFSVAGGTSSKTLTVSNTLTLSGTDGSSLNVGAGGTLGTAAFTNATAYAASGAVGSSGLTMNTARLLGRWNASVGAVEEITVGSGLNLSSGILTAVESGTVSTVSVVTANGFAGTVANASSTPAITLTTTISGIVKGNGSAISAAAAGIDYSAGTSALATGILKSTTTTGALSIAVAGTDFVAPNAAITGSTNTKITYDAKGLVTSSTAAVLASADYVNQGTTGTVLHGNAAGNPSWGQVNLASEVTGRLPLANIVQGTAKSVLGVTGNSTGDYANLTGAADEVLRISSDGTALAFGKVANAGLVNNTISGVALGGNLLSLSAGTGLTYSVGTSFNGSAASTLAVSGITNAHLSGSAGITNANLANSSLTVGSTTISLGGTSTTLAGLTSVTSTTFVGALTGNASSATKATNLFGGNATTLLGSIPYQSATDTTTLLAPNTTATRQVLSMQGTGTNGAAPEWFEIKIENGIVDRAESTLSFVNGTRTFSIAPVGASFTAWSNKTKFVISTTKSIVISNVEGQHFIYLDDNGNLAEITTFNPYYLIENNAFIGSVYWDVSAGEALFVGDERHGNTMDSSTHSYLHNTIHTRWGNGLTPNNVVVDGTGNVATDAQIGVDNGVIWDEDIRHSIVDDAPQNLTLPASIPFFYRSGASGEWTKIASSGYVVTTTGTGRPAYNELTTGGSPTWQLTEVPNNDYVVTHLIATNDIYTPMIWIIGQGTYATIALAQAGVVYELAGMDLGSISGLLTEWKSIASFIVQGSNTYSNAVKGRIRSLEDGSSFYDSRVNSVSQLGSGTSVTSITINSLNGFAGTSSGGGTPALTVSTTVTGMLKGNGTAISAAVAGTDFVAPNAAITGATNTKITYDAKGLVTSGGAATLASADYANQGTTTTVLHGNASGNPTWGAVNLATDVTGDLPFANLAQGTARSVLGVTGNATADVASIQGTANQVLRVAADGLSLAFGTVSNAGLTNSAVTVGSTSISLGATSTTLAGLTSVTSTTYSVGTYGVGLSQSYFGYSSTYKTVQLGSLGAASAISLGVDLTANPSGSFQGNEIVIPNAKAMIAPNAANNGYVGVLRINSSNILELGSSDFSFATPYMKLANGAVSSPSILTLTGNISLGVATSTDAIYAHNNTYGAVVYGYGSTYDAALLDRNTNPIIGVAAGSATVNGNLSVANTTSTITIRSSTTTGTTLGNKGNRLLLASDSSTAGNGGEVVFAANDLDVDRWAAISGHIISNGVGGCVGDIVFATKANTTDTSLTERMRIDSAGAVTMAVSAKVNTGVEGTLIRAYTGSNYGSIYNGSVTPSNTNYVLAHNATTSYLNATGNVYINVNGATVGSASATGFAVIGTLSATGTVTGSNLSGTNTGDNAANSSTHYIGTTAIALNRSSAAQALTGITSIDGSAATLTTARTINGTSFNGSANILTTEWYHSGRDFPTGTLITTSIDYSVTNGDPWVLEIKGNSYGQLIPFDIQVQGYIYSNTLINYGGYSNGSGLTSFSAFNNGGFLCFWFNNAVYWQGFNVRAYTAYGTYALNKVTSIVDSAKPGGITKEVSISLVQSLHSSNFSTYAATAGHTHAGVYEPANANIQSHISNTSNPHSTTATQVGLGNVTNESKATMFTNPTFTGVASVSSASGGFTAGTASDYGYYGNSGATSFMQVFGASGASPYVIRMVVNGSERAQFNTTGLAVTGTLSATGVISLPTNTVLSLDGGGDTGIRETSANIIDFIAGGVTTARISSTGLTVTGTVSATKATAGDVLSLTNNGTNPLGVYAYSGNNLSGIASGTSLTGSAFYFEPTTARVQANNVVVGVFSSTGLAITGTLSSTGAFSATDITASGRLKVAAAAATWETYNGIHVGNTSLVEYTPTLDSNLVSNAYYASGGWKYVTSSSATKYQFAGSNAAHLWSYASSGTAGGAITWVDALTLNSTGLTVSGVLKVTGTTKTAASFYAGATDPTNTDRLNYDGYFYATRFYGDGSQLTNLPSPSASPSDIYAFAAAYG